MSAVTGVPRPRQIAVAAGLVGALLAVLLAAAAAGAGGAPGTAFASLSAASLGPLAACGVVGLVLGASALPWLPASRERERRRWIPVLSAAAALALGLWLLLAAGSEAAAAGPARAELLLCPLIAAFTLLNQRRLQRHRRLPWRLLLMGAGWGALVAPFVALSLEAAFNTLVVHVPDRSLGAGGGLDLAQAVGQAFSAGLVEELAKGLGILVLLVLWRSRFDGMVGGIALGAAVGLGFTTSETLLAMAAGTTDGALYQLWTRLGVEVFASHVAFSMLVGAGLGAALQQRGAARQAVCGASGFVAAVAGHVVWDLAQFTGFVPSSADPTLQTFVVQPLTVVLYQGPFVAAAIVLLALGLRLEAQGIGAELAAEAASGPAVDPAELPALASPSGRRRARMQALLRGGLASYRHVRRLQDARLELAAARWHRARGESSEPPALEDELRRRVLDLLAATAPARARERRPAVPPAVAVALLAMAAVEVSGLAGFAAATARTASAEASVSGARADLAGAARTLASGGPLTATGDPAAAGAELRRFTSSVDRARTAVAGDSGRLARADRELRDEEGRLPAALDAPALGAERQRVRAAAAALGVVAEELTAMGEQAAASAALADAAGALRTLGLDLSAGDVVAANADLAGATAGLDRLQGLTSGPRAAPQFGPWIAAARALVADTGQLLQQVRAGRAAAARDLANRVEADGARLDASFDQFDYAVFVRRLLDGYDRRYRAALAAGGLPASGQPGGA